MSRFAQLVATDGAAPPPPTVWALVAPTYTYKSLEFAAALNKLVGTALRWAASRNSLQGVRQTLHVTGFAVCTVGPDKAATIGMHSFVVMGYLQRAYTGTSLESPPRIVRR